MITLQNENDSKIIKKAQTFQENHDNNKIIEEERDEPINEESQKIKIDKKLEHKDDGLKKTKTIHENQKLTLSRFGEQIEQQKDNKKEEIQPITTKIRQNGKKVKFIDEIEPKTPLKEQIDIPSFKKFNQIDIPNDSSELIDASEFVNNVILKQEYDADTYRDYNINKQALIENKPKIGFWEGIFCCCRKDIIEKRSLNAVIDRIVNRHPNNDNILLNKEEINAINRDIQTYMRD